MFFNSVIFCLFFLLFFVLYWGIGSQRFKLQNILILASSFIFYGWWDYRFLSLILLSTLSDYFIARFISTSKNENKKKRLLITSIILNIGLLVFFKYFNFFLDSFYEMFEMFGIGYNKSVLNIVLPVGISFYTFQTLSYTIDVYRGSLKPTKDIIAFGSFVCFFPQLVAGPIERAENLLPQFLRPRKFDLVNASTGAKQVLWGLFKKVAVADSLAGYVNTTFVDYGTLDGPSIAIGIFFFSLQIYCDFSGYSDIAIGLSRMIGIKLNDNFRYPYFSKSISEFWQKWHISLSSWFRDYLYIPLGGSKGGDKKSFRNVMIVFLVSGFWHGANWTFIVWGAFHGLLYLPHFIKRHKGKNPSISKRPDGRILAILKMLGTFMLVNIGWVFFRASDLKEALGIFRRLIFNNDWQLDNFFYLNPFIWLSIAFLLIMEWTNREREFGLELATHIKWVRQSLYFTTIAFIYLMYSPENNSSFIYFQF